MARTRSTAIAALLSLLAGAPAAAAPPAPVPVPDAPVVEDEPGDYAHGRGLRSLVGGSLIRRESARSGGDADVYVSPLYSLSFDRRYLERQRMLEGAAVSDAEAGLGLGGSGTARLVLRLQPTLILLNGRRLVSSPQHGITGGEYVDTTQIPIPLVERAEVTLGPSAALYGEGATGGVVNYITRRELDGVLVDTGVATADFSHAEADVSLGFGAARKRARVVGLFGYFRRSALEASDRDWALERAARMDSTLGNPASYYPLAQGRTVIRDPLCDDPLARRYGSGSESRLPEHGPLPTLGSLSEERQQELITEYDLNGNDQLDPDEVDRFCTGNYTRNVDLVLSEERIQTFATAEYDFSRYTHTFVEGGLYQNTNSNRAAPSYPVLTGDANLFVPADHADLPTGPPFSGLGGAPTPQFFLGRVEGSWGESGVNRRRTNTLRLVGGLRGDFRDVARDSKLELWDWEVSGLYTASQLTRTATDVVTNRLIAALNRCSGATIEERQQAGCYNPFFSSVTNNAALNPDSGDPSATAMYPAESGGFICDPDDPSRPCPAGFDPARAGTVNTEAVMAGMRSQSVAVTKKGLVSVDGILRGPIVALPGGDLEFGAGWQVRRESLSIGYDDVYNADGYAFLFGGPDLAQVTRTVLAGFGELRWPVAPGVELQTAGRYESYDDVGGVPDVLAAVAYRPFAVMSAPPEALEFLRLRGSFGLSHQAPSLFQLHGSQTTMEEIDYESSTNFRPYRVSGNPNLEHERITTVSGGVGWDFSGFHVSSDYYRASHDELIAYDNPRRLVHDCEEQFQSTGEACSEIVTDPASRRMQSIQALFDNVADVETDGIDWVAGYGLRLGSAGLLSFGAHGSFVLSYVIKSPRALREFYGTETDAAGRRNYDNFAPPIPRLRMTVPLRWELRGHAVGVRARHIGGYLDDSENTLEEIGRFEEIPSWTVFDVDYGYNHDFGWMTAGLEIGALNVQGAEPPSAEGSLGYEVGVHDPRGRIWYARLRGEF